MPPAETRGIIIELKLQLLDGRCVPLKVDQECNVAELKEQVLAVTGIPANAQELRFEEQVMLDDMVLVEVGVTKGDVVAVGVTEAQRARSALNQLGVGQGDLELVSAASDSDIDVVEMLITSGVPPNSFDMTGNSALMHAASHSRLVVMELLMNCGADPNFKGCSDETPLMWAASHDHVEAAQLLVEAGADPLSVDEDGDSALMWAASNNSLDVVRYLAKHSDLQAVNAEGHTALMQARNEGFDDIVEFLESL